MSHICLGYRNKFEWSFYDNMSTEIKQAFNEFQWVQLFVFFRAK